MNSSMIKSKIFAIIALGIFLYGFVIPTVVFHGTLEKIEQGKEAQISPSVFGLWNFYNKDRYFSNTTPKVAKGDLQKMIDNTAEIGVASTPIWSVSLEAPNYPKEAFPQGIPVFFHFDGFSGEVHEMNTINHYIGMDPMERGGPYERLLAPYALVFTAFVMFLFIIYNSKFYSLFMLIPAALPVIFIGLYSYWLYWFGHNMHDYGAFKIKPFMPTVFGDGKVAQFTTHSYPGLGFWLLVAISLLSLLAILSRAKAHRVSH
ncbi:MAG: cytochrome C [Epsilonproteobacteria bacterium]|nr:cytochrome C [Campylobacterota bacterium]